MPAWPDSSSRRRRSAARLRSSRGREKISCRGWLTSCCPPPSDSGLLRTGSILEISREGGMVVGKRHPQDSPRINILEPWDLQYWSNRWKVPRRQVMEAVRRVGDQVQDVA